MRSRAIQSSHKHQCAKLLQGPWHSSQGPSCSLRRAAPPHRFSSLSRRSGSIRCTAIRSGLLSATAHRPGRTSQACGATRMALVIALPEESLRGYESEQDDPGFSYRPKARRILLLSLQRRLRNSSPLISLVAQSSLRNARSLRGTTGSRSSCSLIRLDSHPLSVSGLISGMRILRFNRSL